ncbi:MAG: GxxExxY protein [Candidatus Scalindua sp.]
MELEHKELTEKIIGAAIQVHQQLGPGFIESIYEKALMIEFRKQGLQVKEQQEVIVKYDDIEVGRHRLDLFIEGTIIVELKAIRDLEDIHFAIVKSYLKSVDKKYGLLLNFAKVKLEIKRVIYDE